MRVSIDALVAFRDKMEKAYGASTLAPAVMDVESAEGSLADIVAYASAGVE
jgi:hypothetical protein